MYVGHTLVCPLATVSPICKVVVQPYQNLYGSTPMACQPFNTEIFRLKSGLPVSAPDEREKFCFGGWEEIFRVTRLKPFVELYLSFKGTVWGWHYRLAVMCG